MPCTMEDYQRDYLKENIHLVPLKDRLKGLTPGDLLKAVPPEDLERLRDEIDKLLKKPKE